MNRLIEGTVHHRILTHRGLEFRGIQYSSQELMALRHEKGPGLNVTLSCDPTDQTIILVHAPGSKTTIRAVSSEVDRRFLVRKTASTLYCAPPNGNRGGERREHYDPMVLEICTNAINDVYLRLERGTIQATLDLARHRVHEVQRALDAERDRKCADTPLRKILRPPIQWLIQHLINETPAFDRYAARYGHRAAMIRFHAPTGQNRD